MPQAVFTNLGGGFTVHANGDAFAYPQPYYYRIFEGTLVVYYPNPNDDSHGINKAKFHGTWAVEQH